MPDEIRRSVINYCGPVLMGCKPAALFVLKSENACACLGALLPAYLSLTVLRRSETGLLVFVFHREGLKEAVSDKAAGTALRDMGYPSGSSVPALLDCLKKQFRGRQFPHEVGLFLGYPAEDVLGFVKHQGKNYKLCGYWKVYGDVERAKRCFRRYDECRERLGAATGFPLFPWADRRLNFLLPPGLNRHYPKFPDPVRQQEEGRFF